jgi:hypothetical protein
MPLGRVHTRENNTNTSEIDKSGKNTGKFVIAGANPAKSLEPPEKTALSPSAVYRVPCHISTDEPGSASAVPPDYIPILVP